MTGVKIKILDLFIYTITCLFVMKVVLKGTFQHFLANVWVRFPLLIHKATPADSGTRRISSRPAVSPLLKQIKLRL